MRIAIVDSSRTVLRILHGMLEQWQHQVVTFTDGAEAIDYPTPARTAIPRDEDQIAAR